jgi:thiol reductant ABC exporter CydC subunit
VALVVSGVVLSGLAIVDVRLALVVLALFLLNGIACPLIARRLARGLGVRRNQERGELASHFVLVVQGLEDALAFGHEHAALARARAHQQALDVIEDRYGQRLAANAALGSLLSNLGLWSALALTVSAATAGEMPAVWIAALVLGILAAFEAVEPLPHAWQFRDQIEDAARRVSDVIDTTPAVSDPVDATALSIRSAPSVEFDAVTFAYEDRPVLRDLSIRIAPGEHVAIVGPTGSGKSTLLRLLMRAWDPTSGCVRLNGIDLRKARLRELRSALGVMPQQIHVFNETLRDNVRLARPSASDREIADAVRRAGLGAFLSGLPQGLDTFLGEHGARMSAGERQRLALARLLLTDVPVVLVDEPTANLDAETERAVFQVLSEWARDRTMLLVTHRVASLPPVDRVLILDRGTFQASLC